MATALLAMVVVRFFGMSAGFLCACTGAVSTEVECVASNCHPSQDCEETAETTGEKAPDQAPPSDPHDHRHEELRQSLTLSGVPPVLASPAVALFDLIPSFQLPDFSVLNAPPAQEECPAPPEYGSPPAPQMVARTIVLLV